MERITRRVGQIAFAAAVAGLPVWLLALLLLPRAGLGPGASLLVATPAAVVAAVVVDRRRSPRRDRAAGGRRRARAPMSAGQAVALTLAAVAVLAYVVFVLRSA